ncbi:hypothetical protein OIO90_000111 [Microbotryomycetes sp. JL221]|nr:hypothetical protein OIO90_000111 [Microbotryomycetes sp. JL221]
MDDTSRHDKASFEVKAVEALRETVPVLKEGASLERSEIRELLIKTNINDKRDQNENCTNTWQDRPFAQLDAKMGLLAAGYLEMFDVSRKKIRARFVHGLEKLQFKLHLEAFLSQKGVKPTTEFMVRFVGTTASVLDDQSTIKVLPSGSESDSKPVGSTLWTYLRTTNKNQVHWSCKKAAFWPVRVVLEGPAPFSSDPDRPESSRSRRRSSSKSSRRSDCDLTDDDTKTKDAGEDPELELKRNTRRNSEHINHPKRAVIDFNEVDPSKPSTGPVSREPNADDDHESERGNVTTPSSPPTIGAAVRQLGAAVVSSIPSQITTAVQHQLQAIRGWTRKDYCSGIV